MLTFKLMLDLSFTVMWSLYTIMLSSSLRIKESSYLVNSWGCVLMKLHTSFMRLMLVVYSLRKEMIEQENSLENARASLEQFEKEEQAKLNKAKHEKTAAWIIAGLLR